MTDAGNEKTKSVELDSVQLSRLIANSGDAYHWFQRCTVSFSSRELLIVCPDIVVARYFFRNQTQISQAVSQLASHVEAVSLILDNKLHRIFLIR